MAYYLHAKTINPDGSMDTFHTRKVESKESPMPHHKLGLQYTASGYGKRIPTTTMIKLNGKWRRVYCAIFSSIGTCYIGDYFKKSGEVFTVTEG